MCGKEVKLPTKCNKCDKEHGNFVKSCTECGKEFKAICECGVDILEEYLPGGKETPGKLLDMCRALHAEEITLLNLSKSGRNSSRNQVLYVTTQPCNMCANKIVASGIKKIVYAEPYSMIQSTQILKDGNVEQERFKGIKSSAYFKLYT